MAPVTNLPAKRRLSESEDVKDEVFQPSGPRSFKKEYDQRLVRRSIAEEPAFNQPAMNQSYHITQRYQGIENRKSDNTGNNLSLASSTGYSNRIPNLCVPQNSPQTRRNPALNPTSLIPNPSYSLMPTTSPRVCRSYYSHQIMEERKVVWVTKWVDYSNK